MCPINWDRPFVWISNCNWPTQRSCFFDWNSFVCLNEKIFVVFADRLTKWSNTCYVAASIHVKWTWRNVTDSVDFKSHTAVRPTVRGIWDVFVVVWCKKHPHVPIHSSAFWRNFRRYLRNEETGFYVCQVSESLIAFEAAWELSSFWVCSCSKKYWVH